MGIGNIEAKKTYYFKYKVYHSGNTSETDIYTLVEMIDCGSGMPIESKIVKETVPASVSSCDEKISFFDIVTPDMVGATVRFRLTQYDRDPSFGGATQLCQYDYAMVDCGMTPMHQYNIVPNMGAARTGSVTITAVTPHQVIRGDMFRVSVDVQNLGVAPAVYVLDINYVSLSGDERIGAMSGIALPSLNPGASATFNLDVDTGSFPTEELWKNWQVEAVIKDSVSGSEVDRFFEVSFDTSVRVREAPNADILSVGVRQPDESMGPYIPLGNESRVLLKKITTIGGEETPCTYSVGFEITVRNNLMREDNFRLRCSFYASGEPQWGFPALGEVPDVEFSLQAGETKIINVVVPRVRGLDCDFGSVLGPLVCPLFNRLAEDMRMSLISRFSGQEVNVLEYTNAVEINRDVVTSVGPFVFC